jgi:hypothetical protein
MPPTLFVSFHGGSGGKENIHLYPNAGLSQGYTGATPC